MSVHSLRRRQRGHPALFPRIAATSLCLALSLCGAAGCRQTAPAFAFGAVEMRIGSRTFHLEVAATEVSRSNAMASRDALPADQGVLLVFPSELPREVPLAGVRVPLDVVCLDASGAVVSIRHGGSGPAPTLSCDAPTKFAIELNEGAAAAAGLKVGDRLSLPPEARAATGDNTVEIRLGNRTFELEVAATESAREYGLMNRPSMPPGHGMIFVFSREEPREFWMKNTLIPLDIVYLDASGRVVSIKHGTPRQESPTVPSDGAMKYAIELNDGAAAAAGLKVGDAVAVPPQAREPAEGG